MSVLLTDRDAELVLALLDRIAFRGDTRPVAYGAIAEDIRRKLARHGAEDQAHQDARQRAEHKLKGA